MKLAKYLILLCIIYGVANSVSMLITLHLCTFVLMADRIANALEKLGGDVERVADLLEQSSQCIARNLRSRVKPISSYRHMK